MVGTPLAVVAGENVPQGGDWHERDQATPRFFGSFATVAVNGAVAPAITVAELGFMETARPGTVTATEFVTVLLATAAAVTLTDRSPIGNGGAE